MKASYALILAVFLLLFASCSGRGLALALEADPGLEGRLGAILEALPPPQGFIIVADAGKADIVVSLKADYPGSEPASAAVSCGSAYYAASVDLGQNLYSVSAALAQELGLMPLESISAPRRALAIDGAWPGDKGYPFLRRLFLQARAVKGGEAPRRIRSWIRAAAKAAAPEREPILLTAVGDIQVGEAQGPELLGGEDGIRTLLRGAIVDHLRKADLAVANLESPLSSRGLANPRKRYQFRMPPGASAALKDAGFGLLLFANNHTLDFGDQAFSDTLNDLAQAGMPMVGAGGSLSEAAAARVIEVKPGEELAFVGYAFFPSERMGFTRAEAAAGTSAPGISADEASALASVRAAAAGGATVVVLAHGGAEYVERPSDAARALYARFVDAGAALVIGTHPHLLQGCEARSGSLIAYSLGNFLFTLEDEPPEAWKGAMLDFLVYRGKVRALRPIPIIAGYYYTEPDMDRPAAEARFSRLCAGISRLPALPDSRSR